MTEQVKIYIGGTVTAGKEAHLVAPALVRFSDFTATDEALVDYAKNQVRIGAASTYELVNPSTINIDGVRYYACLHEATVAFMRDVTDAIAQGRIFYRAVVSYTPMPGVQSLTLDLQGI